MLNSKDLRFTPISLIINPDKRKYAQGNIIYDNDGKDVVIDKDYMDIFIKFENNILYFEKRNMLKNKMYKYKDNKIDKILLLRTKELEINYKQVKIYLEDGLEFSKDIIFNDENDSFELYFNTLYEIQNFKYIEFNLNKEKNENNVENNIQNNKNNNIEKENIDNNKYDKLNNNIDNKEKKNNNRPTPNKNITKHENQYEKQTIKTNNMNLLMIKIFIFVLYLILTLTLILYVRMKSIQKQKANYIMLSGVDSI